MVEVVVVLEVEEEAKRDKKEKERVRYKERERESERDDKCADRARHEAPEEPGEYVYCCGDGRALPPSSSSPFSLPFLRDRPNLGRRTRSAVAASAKFLPNLIGTKTVTWR